MKNASLIGLIGAILLVINTLLWWIAPYNIIRIINPIGRILSITGYICIGYYFLKIHKVYMGK